MRILSFDVGVRSLAYVDLHVPDEPSEPCRVIDWQVVDVLQGRSVKRVCFEEQMEALIGELESRFPPNGDAEYAAVLVENQPCMRNPKAKSTQVAIFTYFATLRRLTQGDTRVKCVSACRKLSALAELPRQASSVVKEKAAVKEKDKYAARKKDAIAACRHYLTHVLADVDAGAIFETHVGKRDDLADCFLQAVSYVEREMGRRISRASIDDA